MVYLLSLICNLLWVYNTAKVRNSFPNLNLRKSGLDVVGDLPWGAHFCQFYQTQEDLADVLVRYFKAGLENNEFCVWVTSEFLTKEEALQLMKKEVPDFAKYWKKGQIEIFPYTDWYLKEGKFEMERVLRMWVAKHDEGLARGFEGMRVSGNPFWINNKKDWDDFSTYEATINKVIDPYKLLVLCTYSLEKCGASEIIDVVTNHQFALIKRAGRWEIIESAQQKKAKEALKQSEEALLQANKEWENTFDSFPDLIAILDTRHRIVRVNKAMADRLGMQPQECLGLNCFKCVHKTDRPPLFCPHVQTLADGQEHMAEIHEDVLGGDFLVSTTPLFNHQGKVTGSVHIARDITERIKLEKQKDEFVAIASHELKTPVTSLKLYGQILKKFFGENQDKRTIEIIDKMDLQTNKLTELVNDLLDVSKIQAGKLQFNYSLFSLKKLVQEAITEMQLTTSAHQITLQGGTEKRVYADKDRVGQVLINLLSNAIKYSPEAKKISVKIVPNSKSVTVKVKDFGIGIPKEMREKIFERFYRVEAAPQSLVPGLGLGLYISSEIIKRLGGELTVESKVGRGSTFSFTLPIK